MLSRDIKVEALLEVQGRYRQPGQNSSCKPLLGSVSRAGLEERGVFKHKELARLSLG